MTQAMAPAEHSAEPQFLSAYYRARLLLLVGAALSFVLFWWVAHTFNIPGPFGYNGSLLQQPPGVVAADLLVTLVILAGCTAMASVIAGTVRFDAGLFCACLGLWALSLRSDPVAMVLMYGVGPGVYLTLAAESVLLAALLAVAWRAQFFLLGAGLLRPDTFKDFVARPPQPLSVNLLTLHVQAGVMLVFMLILCRTDEKLQVAGALALSAFFGSAAAYMAFPARSAIWYLLGPSLVGFVGYTFSYANPALWIIGQPALPLSMPLPLDYASIGTAFAILGYWFGRTREETETPAS